MKNSSRDLHSHRISTLLAGPAVQATALGTGDAQSQKGWESRKHMVHRQSVAQAFNDRHLSKGTRQVATKGLFVL